MDLVSILQQQFLECASSLFIDELVDEQFALVINFSGQGGANILNTMVAAFCRDSLINIDAISEVLGHPVVDAIRAYTLAQTLHGCSVTIGAKRIMTICSRFEQLCFTNNVQMLKECAQQLQNERTVLMNKFDTLLRLENQIRTVGAAVPVIKLKPTVRKLGSIK